MHMGARTLAAVVIEIHRMNARAGNAEGSRLCRGRPGLHVHAVAVVRHGLGAEERRRVLLDRARLRARASVSKTLFENMHMSNMLHAPRSESAPRRPRQTA